MINKNATKKRRRANIRKDNRKEIKELGKGLYRGKLHYQINAEWKCKIMHIKIGYLTLKKENKLLLKRVLKCIIMTLKR